MQKSKLKILALHPYGRNLGDWNNRLKRQIELMNERCELLVVGNHLTIKDNLIDCKLKIEKVIKNFKPDVIYVNGLILGDMVVGLHDKIVYDMGSFKSLNILIEDFKKSFEDIKNVYTGEELRKILRRFNTRIFYEKELNIIKNANAIITWDGLEADIIKKIFQVDNIHKISMSFSKIPEPIPFNEKKNRVISIAAKWGRKNKNGRLLHEVWSNMQDDKNIDYEFMQIGHGGKGVGFMSHDKLMDELNNSKVLYCPYYFGGCGTITEGLRLGCNVIIGDWHQFPTYVNNELIVHKDKKNRVSDPSVLKILKAMEKYYPPKLSVPSEEEQITKIMEICESI